jgi:Tol biopolymer transport system component
MAGLFYQPSKTDGGIRLERDMIQRLSVMLFVLMLVGISAARAWPYSGDMMAFESNRDNTSEIYVFDMANGALQNVTNHPAWDYEAAWSVDGLLAFTSTARSNYDEDDEIYVIDPSTGISQNVTQYIARDRKPIWGTNGKLLFESDRDGNWEIYALDMKTGVLQNLTQHPMDDTGAAWWSAGRR